MTCDGGGRQATRRYLVRFSATGDSGSGNRPQRGPKQPAKNMRRHNSIHHDSCISGCRGQPRVRGQGVYGLGVKRLVGGPSRSGHGQRHKAWTGPVAGRCVQSCPCRSLEMRSSSGLFGEFGLATVSAPLLACRSSEILLLTTPWGCFQTVKQVRLQLLLAVPASSCGVCVGVAAPPS